MGMFIGLLCVIFGVALLAIPGFGRAVVKFQNDLRGTQTSDDPGSAVFLQAAVWIVVGIVLMFALP